MVRYQTWISKLKQCCRSPLVQRFASWLQEEEFCRKDLFFGLTAEALLLEHSLRRVWKRELFSSMEGLRAELFFTAAAFYWNTWHQKKKQRNRKTVNSKLADGNSPWMFFFFNHCLQVQTSGESSGPSLSQLNSPWDGSDNIPLWRGRNYGLNHG